jgi:hypothetical protein
MMSAPTNMRLNVPFAKTFSAPCAEKMDGVAA